LKFETIRSVPLSGRRIGFPGNRKVADNLSPNIFANLWMGCSLSAEILKREA